MNNSTNKPTSAQLIEIYKIFNEYIEKCESLSTDDYHYRAMIDFSGDFFYKGEMFISFSVCKHYTDKNKDCELILSISESTYYVTTSDYIKRMRDNLANLNIEA